MSADGRVSRALVVSALLHVSFGALLATRVNAESRRPFVAPVDVWSGEALELEAAHGQERVPRPAAPPPAPEVERNEESKEALSQTDAPPKTEPARQPKKTSEVALVRLPAAKRAAASRPNAGDPAERSAAAASADHAEGGARHASSGAAGLPPGVRDLATAFTRTIPVAARADPIWSRLPLGPAGSMRCVIEVDAEGNIVKAEALGTAVPRQLESLLERTVVHLKFSRSPFALKRNGLTAGKQTLEVEARLLQVRADESYGESNQPMSLQFEAPTRSRPGKAAFQTGTGRRLEVSVAIEAVNVAGGGPE
jgi:hypothetical protein